VQTAADKSLLAALGARYEFLDPAARAGHSGELLARQRETGIEVGFRIVSVRDGGGLDAVARMVEAVNSATRLHHEHIARVWSATALSDTAVAIESEWMPGRTLREVLAQSTRIQPAEAQRILRAVGSALEFAHRTGVVHGAVHPGNILLGDNTGRILLAGFGEPAPTSVRGLNDGSSDLASYAAPEQQYGGLADVRTDLYGLGLVGWHMLSGSPPPTAENLGEVLFKQSLGGPGVVRRLPASTPASLLFALEGALQWDRPLRWSSAAAFLHQLSQGVPNQEAKRRHARMVGVAQSRTSGEADVVTPANSNDALQRIRGTAGPAVSGAASAPGAPAHPGRWSWRSLMPSGVGAVAVAPWTGQRRRPRWALIGLVAFPVLLLVARLVVARAAAASHAAVAHARPQAPAGPTRATAHPPAAPRMAATPSSSPAGSPAATASAASVRSRSNMAQRTATDSADAANKAYAYSHYLRATAYLEQRSVDGAFAAIDEYLAATQLDSSSAATFAGLATAYAALLQHGWYESGEGAALAASRGLAAADHALRLDGHAKDAWVARGTVLQFTEPRSLATSLRSYQEALALAPADAEAWRLYARAVESTGDYGTAEGLYGRALAQDPRSAAVLSDLAELAYLRRRFDDARKLLAAAVRADPRNPDTYLLQVRMRLLDAQFRDAWSDAEMAGRLGYPLPGAAASILVYAQMPDTAQTRARADSLVSETKRRETSLPVLDSRYLALTLMAIGKPNDALDVLEQAYPRGAALWLALQDPGFNHLHGLRRFEQLQSASRAVDL